MTTIRKIVTSKVDGDTANNNDSTEIRPFGETAFYVDTQPNPDKLTLMMFDGNRTHLKSKVLAPGRLYGSDADSGDGNGLDTIKLIPDATLYNNNSDQYLVIDPTVGEPGHIHIRAGGTQDASSADLYLGAEQTFVRVSDTNNNVAIRTSYVGEGNTPFSWNFDNNGYLTLPTGGTLGPEGMGWTGISNGVTQQPVSVVFKSNTGTWHSAITLVGGDDIDGVGAVYLETFNANTETSHQWTFAGDGSTTTPGNVIVNSALIHAVPTVSPAGTIISVPLNGAGDTVDYTGGASVIEVPTNGDTTQVVAGWIITFNGGAQRTVTNRIEAGGYTSIYFADANPGGTLYPLTIQSADYVAASTGNISIFPSYSDANVKLTISANGNITVPGNINYANGVNILSGLGSAEVDFSNVSLIQSPGNLTIQTQSTSTATVTNENGTPGGPGSDTITGQAIYNPEIVLIQPGWTVTGNNLANLTTVTNVTIDGFGTYTITTDTTEVEPFWYNDVYTFTSNATVYSNLVVDGGNIISGYSGINFVLESSGDGEGYSTIELVPDVDRYNSNQYIIVDPTGGEPGHIHIRAGGAQDNSSADLYLGGELTAVRVSDTSGIVTVRTTNIGDPNITLDWLFQPDGNLYFPGIGNNRIGESEPGLVVSSDNSVVLQANNAGASKEWLFSSEGTSDTLTLPGEGIIQSIDDTVALRSVNTSSGFANSIYLGSSGGLGFNDSAIGGNWLEIFRSGTTPEITAPTGNLKITTVVTGVSSNTWTYGTDGSITFPDSTIQTTAWNANTSNTVRFGQVEVGIAGSLETIIYNDGININGSFALTESSIETFTGNITANFANVSSLTVNGDASVGGMGVTMPTRPAFRIYGNSSINWTTANINFKGSSIVVDYNQGDYFNSTTGVFTAPVAGLYNVTLTARIGNNNGQNQIMVMKNNQTSAGNVVVMWECDTNTGTAVHYGVSSVVKLVAGDFLTANITVGNVQFDANDSWTVTYLG